MTTVTPRGFLFALDENEVQRASAAGALGLQSVLEPLWGQAGRAVELDRAWPDLHRALALDDPDGVLSRAILGDRTLGGSASRLALPREVEAISRALARIDLDDLRERFLSCLPGEPDEDADEQNWAYASGWFRRLSALYQSAASARRAVLFTVAFHEAASRAIPAA